MRLDGDGAPETIRTSDLQLRRLLLYPAELRARWIKPSMARVVSRQAGLTLRGVRRSMGRLQESWEQEFWEQEFWGGERVPGCRRSGWG